MPVEIRELIIRTTVVNTIGSTESDFEPSSSDSNQVLIAACVEQVLKILERKRER